MKVGYRFIGGDWEFVEKREEFKGGFIEGGVMALANVGNEGDEVVALVNIGNEVVAEGRDEGDEVVVEGDEGTKVVAELEGAFIEPEKMLTVGFSVLDKEGFGERVDELKATLVGN